MPDPHAGALYCCTTVLTTLAEPCVHVLVVGSMVWGLLCGARHLAPHASTPLPAQPADAPPHSVHDSGQQPQQPRQQRPH
eukprot:CAMPEP_0202877496 /NCGR_PEP_ID=MMETSP1391-20130828/30743_1 /ASSEMBLY_ACC=CAM_ASM_000867 /TAXON_ID=1034604 /ORGANISM="Chlamydomonas leiostraca, Strain SAG 11-49" /LENGTH=79 /DNA_ID=CAMNT_0049559541 /DNA_START=94 /DNA_END=330 /DNA_ORIENTATION=+